MTPRRILIIRPDRIGDVILTTPLMRAVKLSFPGSFVGVLVGSYTAPLLKDNPHIDAIITDDPDGADAGRSGFWNLVRRVRKFNFDTGLMPLPRERHAWMMLLAGIHTRVGSGGKIYQILTATKSVSRNKYIPLRHEADYVMDLGRKIGINIEDLSPQIFLTESEQAAAKRFFEEKGIDFTKPLIGVNPGSKGSSPNWIPERYVQLAEKLSQEYQLFINAGPENSGMKKYFAHLEHSAVVHIPKDLRELASLVSQLSILIAPSTGTLHVAAALKIPTVALFCPLTACSPTLWGPLGNKAANILPPEGFCQHRCPGNPKICTFDETTIDHVIQQVKNVINT